MNKKYSEALEEIKTLRGFNLVELNNDENINKSLDVIEQDLQRLESIDNANHSEALESLEIFKVHYEEANNQWYLQIHFNNDELRVIQLPLLEAEAKDISNLLKTCTSNTGEAMRSISQIEFYVGTIIGMNFIKEDDVFSLAKKQDYEIFKKHCSTIKQALLKAEKLKKENKFLKDALNTLIKIDDSDLSHLKIKAIPQNVAANQDVIKLLKEMLK